MFSILVWASGQAHIGRMDIINIAAGVFIGNMATIAAYICLKKFDVPHEEGKNIPAKYLVGFLTIMGVVLLALIGQGANK